MEQFPKEYLATVTLTGHMTVIIRETEDGEQEIIKVEEIDTIDYFKDVQKLD